MPKTPIASAGSRRSSSCAGRTAPKYHAAARPQVVEREATHRAIALAELTEVPILIVHVSGSEAVEQIRRARGRGLRIYAETCPQYLFLTADDLDAQGFTGAKCICSPPPRDRASQAAIWDGLRDGTLQVFSSDHAPFRYDDPKGKMVRGTSASFAHVPNGIPGLETRLPLLFSAGVNEGRLEPIRVRRADRDQPSQDVWPAPAQGHDRDRLGCRPRALGSASVRSRSPTASFTTMSTTRRTRECAFAAGR